MKAAGYLIGGVGVQTGITAMVLYLFNMAVWSIMTALLGGSLALIGLGLIMWALYPVRSTQSADRDESGADQISPAGAEPA